MPKRDLGMLRAMTAPSAGRPNAPVAGSDLPTDLSWPRALHWLGAARPDPSTPVDVALIGIPAWRTSLSPTGAYATPRAVREALARYSTYADGADLRALTATDLGDVHEPDGAPGQQRATLAVRAAAARLVVALGGDNSITVSTMLGSCGPDLSGAGLVTLDAHHDLRDGMSNGSPVRQLLAAGLSGERVVQVGIADFANSADYAARARDHGITVITRAAVAQRPMADVMAEALDIAGASGGRVHVDLDVDVCDRAVAPGCPASMPGGLSAFELRQAARLAGADVRVVSVDIAEVDTTADTPDGRTVRLAALCVLEAARGLLGRRDDLAD